VPAEARSTSLPGPPADRGANARSIQQGDIVMTIQRSSFRGALAFAAIAFCGGSAAAQISFGVPVAFGTGSDPESVIAVDLDGDGDLELLSTIHSPSRLSLLDNLGDGTFAAPTFLVLDPGCDPAGLASADFDQDGDFDVLVTSRETDEVHYLVNPGDGRLAVVGAFAVGSRPFDIVAFDFDGDGDADAAISNRLGASVSFLRNVGKDPGRFEVLGPVWVGDNPRGLAFGLFDGDAVLDPVVAVHGANRLTVLHWDDSGAISKYAEMSVGTDYAPEDVGVADFDGDGKDDLVATRSNGTENDLVLMLHVGARVPFFTAPKSFDTGGVHPTGLVIHDFDLDTRIDVAAVNARSSSVSALRNLGGTFGAPQVYALLGPASDFVTCGDLDRNGYADLVCTNDGGNSVSVLLNARTNPGSYCIGAPNSAGDGARMGSSGSISVSANDMVLRASGLPPFMNGIYFYGSTPKQLPFHSGYLCIASPITRLDPPVLVNGLGEASRALDLAALPMTAGSVWNFQLWYRDPSFGPGTTNFSDGWRVAFEP
jgi:hypothetical protein